MVQGGEAGEQRACADIVETDQTQLTQLTHTPGTPAAPRIDCIDEAFEAPPQLMPMPVPDTSPWESVQRLQRNHNWNVDLFAETPSVAPDAAFDDEQIDRIASNFEGSTYSGSFDGIGGPCAASRDLAYGLSQRLGRKVAAPKCLFTVEWHKPCQRELDLLHRGDPDTCHFNDIGEFFVDEIRACFKGFKKRPWVIFESLLPLVLSGEAVVSPFAACRAPGHPGRCAMREAQRHVAGFCCQAHSSQGGHKKSKDVTIYFILAWGGCRRLLEEGELIIENVPGILYLIMAMLGDRYWVLDDGETRSADRLRSRAEADLPACSARMDPCRFRHQISRPRDYYVLRHRRKHSHLPTPLGRFVQAHHTAMIGTWRDFFWHHKFWRGYHGLTVIADELSQDLAWAKSRPTCQSAGTDLMDEIGLLDSEFGIHASGRDPSPFWLALNNLEVKFLSGYREHYPACLASLMQDPVRWATTSLEDKMQTLLRSCHLMWADAAAANMPFSRWMSGTETLSCQAFKVVPNNTQTSEEPQCSFNILMPGRDSNCIRRMAGNSMHVHMVGLVLTYCYLHDDRLPRVRTLFSNSIMRSLHALLADDSDDD